MKLGTRSLYVGVAVLVWFATLLACALAPHLDQTQVLAGCQWLIGVIGVAIGGDTLRKSGEPKSAFHPVAAP